MISRGDDTYISSREFTIRAEPVIVGGEEHEDGFTPFVDAISACEHATEVTTDAVEAATATATAANTAAGIGTRAAADLRAAAEDGDFDGADGADSVDGLSSVATVVATDGGATITDRNGTTSADVAKGVKGDGGPKGGKGDGGEQGLQGMLVFTKKWPEGTAVVILDQIHPTLPADPSPCGTAWGSCNPGRPLS